MAGFDLDMVIAAQNEKADLQDIGLIFCDLCGQSCCADDLSQDGDYVCSDCRDKIERGEHAG
jgi:hypothetical protein